MSCGKWSFHFLLHLSIYKKTSSKVYYLEIQRKLKKCQPNFLLCHAYHSAEQIVCDLV